LGSFFIGLDKVLRVTEPYFPKKFRKKSIQAAVDFFGPRMNGEDGLGAIFPAMVNAVLALDALGYEKDVRARYIASLVSLLFGTRA